VIQNTYHGLCRAALPFSSRSVCPYFKRGGCWAQRYAIEHAAAGVIVTVLNSDGIGLAGPEAGNKNYWPLDSPRCGRQDVDIAFGYSMIGTRYDVFIVWPTFQRFAY
jgi:hypothetical protein